MKVTEAWERAREAESRLREAKGVVDDVAVTCGVRNHPHHAFALLTEDEQKRLYALLKGDAQ